MDNLVQVKTFITEQMEWGPRLLALKCGALDSVDSSAIGFIVHLINYATDNNIMVIFYDLKPVLQRLFTVSRLSRYFMISSRSEFENRYVLKLKSNTLEPSMA